MAHVALSPAGFSSLTRLPQEPREEFSRLLDQMEKPVRLRSPGDFKQSGHPEQWDDPHPEPFGCRRHCG
jgi:hypothetical protein